MTKKHIKTKYSSMLASIEQNKESMAEKKGMVNCYTCESCGHVQKLMYADTGVTPFIISCNVCTSGHSKSSFLRDTRPFVIAEQEWFRPSLEETLKLKSDWELEHVLNGGLLRRQRKIVKHD